ncbi:MAG: hypothetical protein KGQ28_03125 [Hyphomicrobiales bacterium]|nr:hypothetical protein [Hyphomicrobiales bacterium]
MLQGETVPAGAPALDVLPDTLGRLYHQIALWAVAMELDIDLAEFESGDGGMAAEKAYAA